MGNQSLTRTSNDLEAPPARIVPPGPVEPPMPKPQPLLQRLVSDMFDVHWNDIPWYARTSGNQKKVFLSKTSKSGINPRSANIALGVFQTIIQKLDVSGAGVELLEH